MEAWDKKKVAIWLATSTEMGLEERKCLKDVNGKSLLAFTAKDLTYVVGLEEETAQQLAQSIAETQAELLSMFYMALSHPLRQRD